MILCTMPRCQTSAGCVCTPYVPPFTPSEADQHYGVEIATLRAEITRLQKELETAREALEAVASILPKYAMKGDTASDDEALDAVLETVTDALKDKEVAG